MTEWTLSQVCQKVREIIGNLTSWNAHPTPTPSLKYLHFLCFLSFPCLNHVLPMYKMVTKKCIATNFGNNRKQVIHNLDKWSLNNSNFWHLEHHKNKLEWGWSLSWTWRQLTSEMPFQSSAGIIFITYPNLKMMKQTWWAPCCFEWLQTWPFWGKQ